MAASTLRLRNDLVISRQGEPQKPVFVIKDPTSGRFFRFGEIELFIAQQLDGESGPDLVRRRVQEKFGAPLAPERLEQFIERLRGLGLISEKSEPPTGRTRQRRIAGDMFYLRFRAFDPDRLFDRLLPKVRFLFTPGFLTLSASMVAGAFVITALNWSEILRQFGGLFRLGSLLLAWLISLVVIVAHEFSHGLTCKYFGGRVREIGFLLIYFQPAFYCNVSDAWLFAEKSKRLWVTFAGAYFELFLWAIATLVWRVTDPDTTINHLALVVTATSAVRSFFNMNPLIKLDGYYLLSDFLEVPNLRRKAVGFWHARLKRLFGAASAPLPETTARERRIYAVYGLLAAVYSYWLLGLIITSFGAYMVWRYQGWGAVLFTALLAGVFRQPLRRALNGVRSELAQTLTRLRFLKKLARIFAVLAIATSILFFWRTQLKVSGEFTILPIHNLEVRTEVEGIIQEVFHDEGDAVNRGDLVVRLADRDTRAELRKTKAAMEEKQANLRLLKAGPRSEQVDLAKTSVAKAEERIKYARSEMERDKTLAAAQLVSQKELEVAEEQVAVREKELQEAREQLKLLLAGSRPEEVEALEAEINRLSAQQRYLEEQLQLLSVTSQAGGVITTRKLKEKIGQHVNKGDLIAEVNELKTVTAEIIVPEKEIADVQVGERVVLKARAYPGRNFEGTVTAVAPIATKPAEQSLPNRTVLVTTQLDNSALLLKPAMSGMAKIYCGDRRALDLISRRFVRYLRVEFWSWW
jgi:putative peptide zinc metalloprotease protein